MKKIFIYFILLSSVLLLTFCSENIEEKIETNDPDFDLASITLDWYPNANHAGLYSAVKHDHFMDNKINIVIDTPSDPATILSLVSHQDSDFGIFYQPDLLLARSQGVPVVAVASIVNEPQISGIRMFPNPASDVIYLSNSDKNIQYVIIDGESKDRTKNIIEKYQS